jgi:hypothetical protein
VRADQKLINSFSIAVCDEVIMDSLRKTHVAMNCGKYPFVNRTIGDWNQLPAEVLESLPCKTTTFRKRLRKVITEWHQGTPK